MEFIFYQNLIENNYFCLLDFVKLIADSFQFVRSPELLITDKIKKMMKELESYTIQQYTTNHWPGTRLNNGEQFNAFHYKVFPESIDVLKKYSQSIFDWNENDFIEDLSFFRKDNSIIMGSIIHEKEWWLNLKEYELKIFQIQYSSLYDHLISIKDKR
jgi:hypothetical protein